MAARLEAVDAAPAASHRKYVADMQQQSTDGMEIILQASEIRARKRLALSRGDRDLAQRLDQAERDLYAQLSDGREPVVGTNIGAGGAVRPAIGEGLERWVILTTRRVRR
jgi:hypothetical protein